MEMSTETTNVLQSYIENKNESFEFWLTIHYKIKGKNVYDKHYIYEGNILYSDNHYGGKIIFKEMRLASKISLEDFVEFMNDTLMNKTVWKEEYNEKHFEAKIRSVEKIKEGNILFFDHADEAKIRFVFKDLNEMAQEPSSNKIKNPFKKKKNNVVGKSNIDEDLPF